MSEAVMMALAMKGMNRQEAHDLIRQLAIKSEVEKQPLRETLLESDVIQRILRKKEIDEALDPRNYLGTAIEQVDLVIQKTRHERKARRQSDN